MSSSAIEANIWLLIPSAATKRRKRALTGVLNGIVLAVLSGFNAPLATGWPQSAGSSVR